MICLIPFPTGGPNELHGAPGNVKEVQEIVALLAVEDWVQVKETLFIHLAIHRLIIQKAGTVTCMSFLTGVLILEGLFWSLCCSGCWTFWISHLTVEHFEYHPWLIVWTWIAFQCYLTLYQLPSENKISRREYTPSFLPKCGACSICQLSRWS